MGIVRIDESQRLEIQECRRMLLSCAGLHPRKGEDNNDMRHVTTTTAGENDDSHPKLVCVTSGVSFLGIAIVNQLLLRGYSVRLIVHNQGATLVLIFNWFLQIYVIVFSKTKGQTSLPNLFVGYRLRSKMTSNSFQVIVTVTIK